VYKILFRCLEEQVQHTHTKCRIQKDVQKIPIIINNISETNRKLASAMRIIVRTMKHEKKSLLLQTQLREQQTYQIQGLLSLRSDSPKIVAAKRLREWMTTPPTICLLTSYNLIHSNDKDSVSLLWFILL
jgi:hypothetical protein